MIQRNKKTSKTSHGLGFRRINPVKRIPKAICRYHVIPIKKKNQDIFQ